MLVDVTLVDTPAGLPNRCICGSSTGPFVDTGVNLGVFLNEEIPGPWVYLCPKCVAAVAGVCGYQTPEQAAARATETVRLEQELVDVRDALEEARGARVHTEASTKAAIREAIAEAMPPVAAVKREQPVPPKAA